MCDLATASRAQPIFLHFIHYVMLVRARNVIYIVGRLQHKKNDSQAKQELLLQARTLTGSIRLMTFKAKATRRSIAIPPWHVVWHIICNFYKHINSISLSKLKNHAVIDTTTYPTLPPFPTRSRAFPPPSSHPHLAKGCFPNWL